MKTKNIEVLAEGRMTNDELNDITGGSSWICISGSYSTSTCYINFDVCDFMSYNSPCGDPSNFYGGMCDFGGYSSSCGSGMMYTTDSWLY